MAKRRAPDAVVMAFLEAVYPGNAELMIAFFDEATVLSEATRQLRQAVTERARTIAALRERAKRLRRHSRQVPGLTQRDKATAHDMACVLDAFADDLVAGTL